MTTTDITFHGDKGWRFAYVEHNNHRFTIREAMPQGLAIYEDIDGDDCFVAMQPTVDAVLAFITIYTTA